MRAHPGEKRILFLASGPAPLAVSIIERVEARFSDHQVHLVMLEQALGHLSVEQRERVVFVVGRNHGRLAFLWRARRAPYRIVIVLLTGQPGYLTMKLAGLLLGAGHIIICYNEHADSFAIDRRHAHIIATYINHRLGVRGGFASSLSRVTLGLLYTAFGEPLGLVWMTLQIALGRLEARATFGSTLLDRTQ